MCLVSGRHGRSEPRPPVLVLVLFKMLGLLEVDKNSHVKR